MQDKKETVPFDIKTLQALREQLLADLPSRKNMDPPLVKGNKYKWERMTPQQRMAAIGEYIEDKKHRYTYKAFTLRFSEEKMLLLELTSKKADYVRRLIAAHCRRKGYKLPAYAFVFERCSKGYLHLHGVIKYPPLQEFVIKDILRCVGFGAGFRTSPMSKYVLKIKELSEPRGWLSYMFKSNNIKHQYVYVSNELRREVKKYFSDGSWEKQNDRY